MTVMPHPGIGHWAFVAACCDYTIPGNGHPLARHKLHWRCGYSNFYFFIFFYFMETGLCNSKGHKKIATYIRELILILDPVQRQDKTLHNSYVCI